MPIECLAKVKDMFIFSCYTGLSYADIAKLSVEHVIVKEDESKWIIIHRTKTKIRSPIPLLPVALTILSKYLLKATSKPFMPIASNQKSERIFERDS